MTRTSASLWVLAYIVSIVAVNQLYVVLPMQATPLGEVSWANLVVGSVFVLRDYAQRSVGHYVLLATLVAGILTWFMVDPALAVASIVAFTLSEMTDWAVYSFTRRPLQQRIILSSMLSVPVDTVAFLYLIDFLNPASFSVECISKAIGVGLVWYALRRATILSLSPRIH
jgi:queuosine precursor transporter